MARSLIPACARSPATTGTSATGRRHRLEHPRQPHLRHARHLCGHARGHQPGRESDRDPDGDRAAVSRRPPQRRPAVRRRHPHRRRDPPPPPTPTPTPAPCATPVANFSWLSGNPRRNITFTDLSTAPAAVRSRHGFGTSVTGRLQQRAEPVPQFPEQQRDLERDADGHQREWRNERDAVGVTVKEDRTAGQSLVEFALVLPIFILLLFGLIDGGAARLPAQRAVTGGARGCPAGVGRGKLDRRDRCRLRCSERPRLPGVGRGDEDRHRLSRQPNERPPSPS